MHALLLYLALSEAAFVNRPVMPPIEMSLLLPLEIKLKIGDWTAAVARGKRQGR